MARIVEKLQAEFIDLGHLGMPTGKGFYNYPNPAYESATFLKWLRLEISTEALVFFDISVFPHTAQTKASLFFSDCFSLFSQASKKN